MNRKLKCKDLLLKIILIIFCICVVAVEFQNDTFFSIAVGNQIVNEGIDMSEHLTWHEGLVYTYSHWLFDVINIFLYNLAGFKAIYIMVLVMTIAIGLTLYNVLKGLNKGSYFISFIVTAFTLVMGSIFFTARAQIVSYLLFILEIYFIEKLLDTNKKRYIIGLIIIPIIIANVHAAMWLLYFVFYLPYLAEAIFNYFSMYKTQKREIEKLKKQLELTNDASSRENILEKINKKEIELKEYNEKQSERKVYFKERKYIKTLVIVFIITMFTGILTPIKDTPYTYILKTMGGISPKYISELRPAVPVNDVGVLVFVGVFVVIMIYKKSKISLADLFMILGLVSMAAVSIRCMSYLLFIGCIPLTSLIYSILGNENIGILDELYENLSRKKWIKIFFIFFTVIIALSIFVEQSYGKKFVNEAKYPVEACNYILENIDIENMRLYNGFNYGSYIEYRGIPVFIDSRSEMYTEQYNDVTIFQDHMDIIYGNKTYKDVFEKYQITHVLVPKDDIVSKYIIYDNEYNILYEDKYFVLYEKI